MMKHLFNALLLTFGIVIIPVQAGANCDQIEIQALHALDLGYLRARVGSSGWAYMDREGELFTSSAIAQDSRFPPSLGLVRVTGPVDSTIQLRVERIKQLDDSSRYSDSLKINNFLLFAGGQFQIQQIAADLFELVIPHHQERERMSVDVRIGAEMEIKSMVRAQQLELKLQLNCMQTL